MLWVLSPVILYGQNLNMTFSAIGAASKVDSIKATNLRTNESITLPGNDTLVLSKNTGIYDHKNLNQQGIVFPNPFQEITNLAVSIPEAQQVSLEMRNLTGQLLASTRTTVNAGFQTFSITVSKTGVYLVSISTLHGTESHKVICMETSGNGNTIRFNGTSTGSEQSPLLKGTALYTLGYTAGDIILYRCRGDIYTTIVTDSPTVSKNYTVDFELCQDPDGRNYAIVHIGNQTWMAENLAWLPKVSASTTGSDSLRHFYVYGYEDTIVSAAKATLNYTLYGALYNWPAAILEPEKEKGVKDRYRGVCPSGWHIPYDEEWKVLETNLGMSWYEADSVYLRNSGGIGKLLKSSTGWNYEGNGSNASGFTALPGGYRNTHGGFIRAGNYGLFWTGTQSDTISWFRSMNSADTGVYRLKTLRSQGFSVRCLKDAF